jgi:hypothetical protein
MPQLSTLPKQVLPRQALTKILGIHGTQFLTKKRHKGCPARSLHFFIEAITVLQ